MKKLSNDITIQKLHQPALQPSEQIEAECVIVIDVIRAFTTAAYAFNNGAEKIILVSTPDEAFALKAKYPSYELMGEVGGEHIPGFNYCNSPVKVGMADVKGKTLVQRTSSGTQGVVRSVASKKILCSSFVVAESTFKRICQIKPKTVTFLITGGLVGDGDEDLALADYVEKLLVEGMADPRPYLTRVVDSPNGQNYVHEVGGWRKKHDLDAVLALDKFPFAMEIFIEDNLPVLRPVLGSGSFWNIG